MGSLGGVGLTIAMSRTSETGNRISGGHLRSPRNHQGFENITGSSSALCHGDALEGFPDPGTFDKGPGHLERNEPSRLRTKFGFGRKRE